MGLIYSMVTVSLKKERRTLTHLESKNLGLFLSRVSQGEARAFYIYGSECNKVLFDPPLEDNISIDSISFSPDIKVLAFDSYGTLQEQSFASIYVDNQEHAVCLRYEVSAAGLRPFVLLKESNRYTYTHPYFDEVTIFKSKAEAKEAMLKSALLSPSLGMIE